MVEVSIGDFPGALGNHNRRNAASWLDSVAGTPVRQDLVGSCRTNGVKKKPPMGEPHRRLYFFALRLPQLGFTAQQSADEATQASGVAHDTSDDAG